MTSDIPAIQTGQPSPEQVLREAVALHQAGELQEAEKRYRAILQAEPHHPKANHNLGALCVQRQQPVAGLPYFAAAVEADPAHGQYWLSYIDALSQAGQQEESRQVLALARQSGLEGEEVDILASRLGVCVQPKEASPTSVPASRNSVQQNQPKGIEQKKAVEKSSRHHGKEPSAQAANDLVTLFSQGRYEEAVSFAKVMTRQFPDYGFGWKVMGAALEQMGKSSEAFASMQRAVKLLPKDAEVHKNLGITLQALGRAEESVTSLTRSLQIDSGNADAHCNLGVALQSLGRSAEAESSYRRAIELKPNFAEAHNNLATILHAKGRLDDAERSYRRALEINPDFADAYGNLGTTLHAKGQLDEALAHFQRRARLTPGNAVDQHLIASLTGENTQRAPVKYVESVFDSYASSFDTHLRQALQYDIPKKLLALISRHPPNTDKWDILDLGCGTGLIGIELEQFARRMIGVDLSAKMLEQARIRNVYQRLEQSDLVPMMQGESSASFDVIVAADVFVYLGKLDEVIAEVRRLLRPGGIFAFSVEDCDASPTQSDIQDERQDYLLKNTGRYGQSVDYLSRLASANGLEIGEMVATSIRTEHGKPIAGHICIWSKGATATSAKAAPPTASQLLQQAVTCHQSGQMQEAESLYGEILKIEPGHPEANHNLGTLAVQSHRPADGLSHFVVALEADPARGQYWLSYIDALNQDGQTEAARGVLAMARQYGLSGDDVDVLAANLLGEPVMTTVLPPVYCPVCGGREVSFVPLPDSYRENARTHGFAHFGKGEMISLEKYSCCQCGASDRERLYALWIVQQLETGRLSKTAKVMHFAPEAALSKKLRPLFADYQTADFGMAQVDHKADIQSLPFSDETYDFFICSHVLEHVENDDQALSELYRITRTGGCGILVAPISLELKKTEEDSSVTDEAGRWRLFGQNDHVRLYAHDDYVSKIRSHGFRVEELDEHYFGKEVFRSLGLKQTSILYIVSK